MSAPKMALLVAWFLCAAGFVILPDSQAAGESMPAALARWARYGFALMVAAHVLEFALFFSRLKNAPGSLMSHFLNTLVFGVLHVRELPPETEPDSA